MIDRNRCQNFSLRKLAKCFNIATGAFNNHLKNKEELFYRTSFVLS